MSTIGERCKRLRKVKGITQEEMAKIFDVAPTTISTCEITGRFSVDMLIKYANYFDVSTDYLLGRTRVKSQDHKIQFICDKTGLGEKAVSILLAKQKHKVSRSKVSCYQNPENYWMLNINEAACFISDIINNKHFGTMCTNYTWGQKIEAEYNASKSLPVDPRVFYYDCMQAFMAFLSETTLQNPDFKSRVR